MGNTHTSDGNICPLCGRQDISVEAKRMNDPLYYYNCPKCGCFFAPNQHSISSGKGDEKLFQFNIEHLKNYLFYHPSNLRPVLCEKDYYEKNTSNEYTNIYNISPDMVESWYPKTFSEKINLILLYLAKKMGYMGEHLSIELSDTKPLFFMTNTYSTDSSNCSAWDDEIIFILSFLKDNNYVIIELPQHQTISNLIRNKAPYNYKKVELVLTSKAMETVYNLERTQADNKNVFVAMKFGDETKALREKIKEGLEGYNVRIMDEVEHNHQIVPEMLYEIKNCKFVVSELSDNNNGAYYEAGYALGLGKEVIHICEKKKMKSRLHFDVSQINTIIYENIDEIPEKLKKRIKATIEKQ